MKTSAVVAMLLALDPNDEFEVVCGNNDIFFASKEPGYYDGCARILIRDESKPDYNVTGVRIDSKITKIQLHTLDIELAIYDTPELPVEMDEYAKKHWADRIEEMRVTARALNEELGK